MSDTYLITLKISNTFSSAGTPVLDGGAAGIPHAFVTIAGPSLPAPITVGYYPAIDGRPSAPGTVRNDGLHYDPSTNLLGEHPYDRSYTFAISAQQAFNALRFATGVAINPGTYQLLGAADMRNVLMADGYQCTGFARDVLGAAGIEGFRLNTNYLRGGLAGLIGSELNLISKYPGMLGLEFGWLPSNQYQPYRSSPSQEDFLKVSRTLYQGIRLNDPNDITPPLSFEVPVSSGAPSTPVGSNSTHVAVAPQISSHNATYLQDGNLNQLWMFQRDLSGGFADWQEFQRAVFASNPGLTQADAIRRGAVVWLPEKQRDGSITYHYANGVSVNTNTASGEYHMTVPDGQGGQVTYERVTADDIGYNVRQITTDAGGNILEEMTAYQAGRDAPLQFVARQRTSTDAAFDAWGGFDPFASDSFFTQDSAGGLGIKAPLAPLSDIGILFNAEERLRREYNAGWLSQGQYDAFQDFTVNYSLTSQTGSSGLGLQPPAAGGFWSDPIGAFYDSQSAAFDNAASIAEHTGVLLDASGRRIGLQQLTAMDADGDGALDTAETAGLSLWRDLNEDGRAGTGEIVSLADTPLGSIASTDWALRTQGHEGSGGDAQATTHRSAGAPSAPIRLQPTPARIENGVLLRPMSFIAQPASNYRQLRDTNNIYVIPDGRFITWSASQVKINFNSRDTLIGTDGDDAFDASYYGAYGSWFNLSLLTRFMGGGGNDLVGGSSRNDTLWGGTGNDTLWGYDGNDILFGEEDDDELLGHAGNDMLDGGTGNDRLFGGVGNDHLYGRDGDDVLVGFNPSNSGAKTLLPGETDDDWLLGGKGNDSLYGGWGNDILDGGDGNDVLLGESGNDELWGGVGDDELQGGDGDDLLAGEAGDDCLFGQVGNDRLWGGDGNDVLVGFTASNEAQQTLRAGQTDDDQLYGEGGNDDLYGFAGNDLLDGGTGDDMLDGGDGDDQLFGGDGRDELQGGRGNDQLVGGDGDDRLFGQVGNDTLWGGDGDDLLYGFTGTNEAKQSLAPGETDDDVLVGGAGSDILVGGLGNDTLYGGTGRDELQGNAGDDVLFGEEGDDNLFGQAGDDELHGGDGDDFLMGFTASNEAQQTLADGETDNDRLYGGAGHDTLVGGWGDDWLDGGAGADVMAGGAGDDAYVVNSVNDVVYEAEGEGHDVVYASTTHLLSANVEDLHLLEGFAIHGTGNALDNLIIGNSADNILDGVTGADTMVGGRGNDTYYVDDAGDRVVEEAGQGIDTVQSSVSHTLEANVENLILLDFAKPEHGLVDGRAVWVYGYPKRNELDYMQGDAVPGFLGTCALTSIANVLTQMGRPTSESQVVTRAIDKGWTVNDPALPAWRLGGSSIEDQRRLLDSYGVRNEAILGYNEAGLANLLRGGRGVVVALNAGVLWEDAAYQGSGAVNHAVTLSGAVYAQDSGDLVGFYLSDSGRGLVNDMTRFVDIATFRAAADVAGAYALFTRDPVKLWDEDLDATGNELDNTLAGNRGHNRLEGLAGNDVLLGEAGDDILDGGQGNDTLAGGSGDDTYLFGRGGGRDRIVQADARSQDHDVLQLGNGIDHTWVWFSRSGSDLAIDFVGTTDRVTMVDWFTEGNQRVDQIRTSDGMSLAQRDVQQLVDAMAAFSAADAVEARIEPRQLAMLAPVLGTSWHAA